MRAGLAEGAGGAWSWISLFFMVSPSREASAMLHLAPPICEGSIGDRQGQSFSLSA